MGLGLAAVVHRYRHGDLVSRHQIRWFGAAVGLCVVGTAGSTVESAIRSDDGPIVMGLVLYFGILTIAGGDRHRRPALPAVRDRPDHQPDDRLGDRHQRPGDGVRRRRPRPADPALGRDPGPDARRRRVDLARLRALPAGPPPRPAGRRPSLRSRPLRRAIGRPPPSPSDCETRWTSTGSSDGPGRSTTIRRRAPGRPS